MPSLGHIKLRVDYLATRRQITKFMHNYEIYCTSPWKTKSEYCIGTWCMGDLPVQSWPSITAGDRRVPGKWSLIQSPWVIFAIKLYTGKLKEDISNIASHCWLVHIKCLQCVTKYMQNEDSWQNFVCPMNQHIIIIIAPISLSQHLPHHL